MNYYETETTEPNEHVFIGKRGERLTITESQLVLETAKRVLIINLKLIVSFICEKHGKYFKIHICSRRDVDFADVKVARNLLLLKAEDTEKLTKILKSIRM